MFRVIEIQTYFRRKKESFCWARQVRGASNKFTWVIARTQGLAYYVNEAHFIRNSWRLVAKQNPPQQCKRYENIIQLWKQKEPLLFPKEVVIIHNFRPKLFQSSHKRCWAAANYSDLWGVGVRLARTWCKIRLSLIAIHHSPGAQKQP